MSTLESEISMGALGTIRFTSWYSTDLIAGGAGGRYPHATRLEVTVRYLDAGEPGPADLERIREWARRLAKGVRVVQWGGAGQVPPGCVTGLMAYHVDDWVREVQLTHTVWASEGAMVEEWTRAFDSMKYLVEQVVSL